MTAYLVAVFVVAIVASASLVDVVFSAAGWVPPAPQGLRAHVEHFAFDATFWLNIAALALAAYVIYLNCTRPVDHHCAMHEHHGHENDPAGSAAVDAQTVVSR